MRRRIALSTLLIMFTLSGMNAQSATVNLEQNIAQINSSIEKANYLGADEVIYRTLSVYKDNLEVQALAAVSWAMQSKLELAQDQINKLRDVLPKSSNLHFAQGVVFYKRITSSNLEYRDNAASLFDKAYREFKYSVQLDPENYKAYNALGVVELKLGNIDEARNNINKALSICPNYAVAVDNLGTVFLAEQNYTMAEHYFKKAIEINKNTSSAYYHMAQLECDRGNYSQCLTYLDKCLAWKGYSSYAYNLRGDAFRLQGNEAAAIGAYKKAIEITPENLSPYANLASIYEARKDYELALDLYKTMLSVNPDSQQTLLKVADMFLETGKYDDAIAYYDKLNSNLKTEGVKGLASAYYGMAMDAASKSSFSSDKRLIEAYNYLDQAIKMNPDDLELYLAKAKISSILNQPGNSTASLQQILSKQCRSIDDYLVKGDAYAALSEYKAAASEYQSAIKMAKTANEKLILGELFTFNKQFDEASTVFNDLLKMDSSNTIAQSNLAYIKKSRDYANLQVKSGKYFRIRNSMFFEREYLNKALKADPYNVDANILMGRLNQRQRKYAAAYDNYALVVAKTNSTSVREQYLKRLKKMKEKLDATYGPNYTPKKTVQKLINEESKEAVINAPEPKSTEVKKQIDTPKVEPKKQNARTVACS